MLLIIHYSGPLFKFSNLFFIADKTRLCYFFKNLII